MTRPIPLHPVLLATFPVLYLLAQNVDEASIREALPSLGLVLAMVAAVWLVLTPLLHDARRSGLIVSVAVVLTFAYGYVVAAVAGLGLVGRHRFVLPVWLLLGTVLVVLVVRLRGRGMAAATRWLNAVAVILVVLNAAPVVAARLGGGDVDRAVEQIRSMASPRSSAQAGPDIYYLVFDRYGGPTALEEVFGFDNGAFWDALETRGFFVASEGRANYPTTVLSLASSLNMAYLDPLSRAMGPRATDLEPLAGLIRDRAVGRFLTDRGYDYVHVGSWWEPTSRSPIADRNVRFGGLSEFAQTLLDTTAVAPVVHRFAPTLEIRRREYERVRFQFDQVEAVRGNPSPTFVFAHILVPHGPYVFAADGSFVPSVRGIPRSRRYLEQLAYVNERILRLVDRLLDVPPGREPVIILQADEGPFNGPGNWRKASAADVRRKFSILSAYRLPGSTEPGLRTDLTPVNSFRVVLNRYLGTDLPLLPDRSFAPVSTRDFYTFIDVTDRGG